MDLILKLAVGKKNYDVCAPSPFQLPEFDFLYTERKSATKKVDIFDDDTVIGTFGGREFSRARELEFFGPGLDTISRPSLVGKDGQAVLDESIRKSREILADQIELDSKIHSSIVSEIKELVRIMRHPNKVVVKLHKLLIHNDGDFSKTHIDVLPQTNEENAPVFTALVLLSGTGILDVGGEKVLGNNERIAISVFNPQVGYSLWFGGLALVFQVFDTGVPNPEGLTEAFSMAIARGFNKVAMHANESYGAKRVKASELRGVDKLFAQHARASGAKRIEVCELYESGRVFGSKGRVFRSEILSVVKIHDAFDSCFKTNENRQGEEEDDDDDEAEEDKDEQPTRPQQSLKKRSLSQLYEPEPASARLKRGNYTEHAAPSPAYDEKGVHDAVKDEYRLGDTLFLATSVRLYRIAYAQRTFQGQKCMGSVNSSFAIIAHF